MMNEASGVSRSQSSKRVDEGLGRDGGGFQMLKELGCGVSSKESVICGSPALDDERDARAALMPSSAVGGAQTPIT